MKRRSVADIFEVTGLYRAKALKVDADVATSLTQAYGLVLRKLNREIDALAGRIASMQADGREVTRGALLRMDRYRALRAQLNEELRRVAIHSEGLIAGGQATMVELASEQALRATLAALPPGTTEQLLASAGLAWNRLPADALLHMSGALGPASPLRSLLDAVGPQVANGVGEALLSGVGLGWNPAKVAKLIHEEIGMGLTRSLLISRTEMLRSYRSAALDSYRANPQLVEGWVWTASPSSRTCVSCWAMDGTVHSLDEAFGDHPAGRCTPRPKTLSWRELGVSMGEPKPGRAEGAELFEAQPEETKLLVLGRAGYEAYKRGDATLRDFATFDDHPTWGRTLRRRSIREIVGVDASEYVKRAA